MKINKSRDVNLFQFIILAIISIVSNNVSNIAQNISISHFSPGLLYIWTINLEDALNDIVKTRENANSLRNFHSLYSSNYRNVMSVTGVVTIKIRKVQNVEFAKLTFKISDIFVFMPSFVTSYHNRQWLKTPQLPFH